MPGVERLQARFAAAHTQVLGVSVDSKFCHAGWGDALGGISFPLLADFQPKGATAKAYGLFLDGPGITDRATVIIDKDGVVRWVEAVGPGGEREIETLLSHCEAVDKEHGAGLSAWPKAKGWSGPATLYVKSNCGFSSWTLQARSNLHLESAITVKNVSEDAAAKRELEGKAGKGQAPCLVTGDDVLHESADIIAKMTAAMTDI
ncbi:MAG: redoxin domain-containing protein [Deltaproteobacteria bacterium]|nr:redoxin domain-containing protein [Deltaproteobacteria bacterium]